SSPVRHSPPTDRPPPSTAPCLPFVLRTSPFAVIPPYTVRGKSSVLCDRHPLFIVYGYRSTSVVEPGHRSRCRECWEWREDFHLPRFTRDQSFPLDFLAFVVNRFDHKVSLGWFGHLRIRRLSQISSVSSVFVPAVHRFSSPL